MQSDAIDLKDIMGAIEFNDVTFRYSDSEEILIRSTLYIKPENLAFVGPSGAGKTTFATYFKVL